MARYRNDIPQGSRVLQGRDAVEMRVQFISRVDGRRVHGLVGSDFSVPRGTVIETVDPAAIEALDAWAQLDDDIPFLTRLSDVGTRDKDLDTDVFDVVEAMPRVVQGDAGRGSR